MHVHSVMLSPLFIHNEKVINYLAQFYTMVIHTEIELLAFNICVENVFLSNVYNPKIMKLKIVIRDKLVFIFSIIKY